MTPESSCQVCGIVIPARASHGRPAMYCSEKCKRQSPKRKAWLAAHADEINLMMKKWRKENASHLLQYKQADARRAQAEGLLHYGGKCSCCGETELKFLTIEHVNGRKNERVRYSGKRGWQDLKRRGWPENITILCFNCNCARGAFGECPHIAVRKEVQSA